MKKNPNSICSIIRCRKKLKLGDFMNKKKNDQSIRLLSLFDRLKSGKSISKFEEATRFGVSEKTIQRDIADIREYLEIEDPGSYLVFNKKENSYSINRKEQKYISSQELLAIVKILMDSRAFPKKEMHQIIDCLLELSVSENKKFIESIISNEKYLYESLQNSKSIFDTLWELAKSINSKNLIKISYKKEYENNAKTRFLKPVGLIFSEFYFYLIAYQSNENLDFPKTYRVDRIEDITILPEKFKVPYSNRFQEGEFKKRVQFMYSGELLHIKFRYTGWSPQAILDRLPTAKILKQDESGTIFTAEVFGEGIKMWLLSQAEHVEVLEPAHFRDNISKTIRKMDNLYEN